MSGHPADCTCCAGARDRTPAAIVNRPGLSVLGYRAGTYATFKQSMLAGLSSARRPALAELGTRADDDFSIALIDAWAVAGDVLTFYIERTVQEHYLGTATERRSVDALVQLIGYRLAPGVAATTWLAFTLETVPDGARGFRPQPAPGVPAVVPIPAGVRVQSIPGPGELPQTFETVEMVEALAEWNTLQARLTERTYPKNGDDGAWLAGVGLDLNPGDLLLFVADDWSDTAPDDRWATRRLTAVAPDAKAQRTRVTWKEPLDSLAATDAKVEVFSMRQRASLFGYNAPDPRLFTNEVQTNLVTARLIAAPNADWVFEAFGNDRRVDLDTLYRGLEPGGRVVFERPGGHRALARIVEVGQASKLGYSLGARVTWLVVEQDEDALGEFFGAAVRETALLIDSEPLPLAETPNAAAVTNAEIALAHPFAAIAAPRAIIVRGRPDGDPSGPIQTEVATVLAVEQDGTGPRLVLAADLMHSYERATVEILGNVARATHGETVHGTSVRTPNNPIVGGEVLGSGDGSRPYQQFTLRKGPLTYVRSTTAGVIESTLSVWVNGLRWSEVPALFGHGPRDRVYVTRITDDGQTIVQFGDGESGERLPTGQDNVVARYRTGTGVAGELDAGQLSLLMDRPLGVRGATNPIAPQGAADRQGAADARTNAPRSVLTLGRIVSLQDYEDFARDTLGIEKATAIWTWDGRQRGVLITVAGTGGERVPQGELVHDDLVKAMARAGSPRVPFIVKGYRPVAFRLSGTLRVAPERVGGAVLQAVRDSLVARFAFAARDFGQLVSLSEVYAAIHATPGVVAADIDHLYRGDDPRLDPFLAAVAPGNGAPPTVDAAELLTLDLASLEDLELPS